MRMPELNCFVAAICRDLSEGGTGDRYFVNHAACTQWMYPAFELGLLDGKGKLTPKGRAVGEACQHIATGRAYVYYEDYERCAKDAAEAFRIKSRKRVRLSDG